MWLGEESKSGLKTGDWCKIVDSSVKRHTHTLHICVLREQIMEIKKALRLELAQKAAVILL
jgi:hypothetical protein